MFGRNGKILLFSRPGVQKLVENDAACTDGYETVSKVENSEGPCLCVEQDIVDDVTVKEAVEKITRCSGDDEGKTEMGEGAIGSRLAP